MRALPLLYVVLALGCEGKSERPADLSVVVRDLAQPTCATDKAQVDCFQVCQNRLQLCGETACINSQVCVAFETASDCGTLCNTILQSGMADGLRAMDCLAQTDSCGNFFNCVTRCTPLPSG
jgi:hypothetical protein